MVREHFLLRVTAVSICLLAALTAVQASELPELPQINTTGFAPALKEQFHKAYAEFQENTGDAEASGKLGMILHAYEQLEWAALCYGRAHLLAPDVFEWKHYLGVVQSLLGRHEDAAAMLKEAVSQRPDYLPAKLKLADSLLASSEMETSRQLYDEVLQSQPDLPLAHYGLGRLEAASGQDAAAVKHYTRACEIFPQFGAAHYALGLLYRKLGEQSKAGAHLLRYQQDRFGRPQLDDPLLAKVERLNQGALYYLKKGAALEATGKLKEALLEYENALKADPRSEQAHLNLLTLYGKLGQAEKTRRHYETLVKLNPNLAESHYNFGVFLVSQEQFQQAADMFRKALEINPYHAEAHNNLAFLLEQ